MSDFLIQLIVFMGFIWFIFHIIDRIKNPEKWKIKDFERDVHLFIVEHQMAFERIPKSTWIEMSRDEKARIYRSHEKMKAEFFAFPQATWDAIKKKYDFDDTFQGVD